MKATIISFLLYGFAVTLPFAPTRPSMHEITKNGMTVRWAPTADSIRFELQAPTTGWLAIGFNQSSELTGNWLLMARVINGRAEVVEHHTLAPGNYQPIAQLGEAQVVQCVSGSETKGATTLAFSLPRNAAGRYQKSLASGSSWQMLLAYSRSDDFQHHSVMRTTTQLTL